MTLTFIEILSLEMGGEVKEKGWNLRDGIIEIEEIHCRRMHSIDAPLRLFPDLGATLHLRHPGHSS